MSENAPARKGWPVLWTVGAVLLLGVVLLVGSNRRNVSAGLNTPIRYDDFHFRVESVRIPAAGAAARAPGRIPYELTIRVDNRAKRVGFQFVPASAVLVDRKGAQYRPAPLPARPAMIPAGSSATYELVYDLPEGVAAPRLRMMSGGAIGDMLETIFSGDKEFQLPDAREVRASD